MKRNKDRPLVTLAVGLALVVGTYTLPGTGVCHDPEFTDVCRNILNPPPDSTVVIGSETCTIDSNSYNDQMVGRSWQASGHTYCIGSTTYCGVAYDCPVSGLQLVQYLLPQDGSGWFEIYYATFPRYCADCPNLYP